MDRQECIEFCHNYADKYFYQPVVFVPGVIEIRGKWDAASKQLSQTLFEGIRGKTVLDAGCNIGFFLHEALRFGASEAVGIDHDAFEFEVAENINDIMDHKATLWFAQIEYFNPDPYDMILMLNVLHVVKNPEKVLEKYLKQARQVLIVEHIESQEKYFPVPPSRQIPSPRCHGRRILSYFEQTT